MTKVLSILLLLSASSAAASVQPFKPDDSAIIHPVRTMEKQPVDVDLKRYCGRPVLILMRMPDGRVILIGVLVPKSAC